MMDPATLRLIALGIDLAAAAATGAVEAVEGAALVKRLVAEARDPTEAEWADLNALFKILTDGVHQA